MSCTNCGNYGCSGCHSCTSCNSSNCSGNCGCSCSGNTTYVNPCVQCGGTSGSCGCTYLPGTPTPFYAQSGQCQEDHCQTIIKNWFATCISVTYGFNIPGCGTTAILIFQDVKKLTVGTYLWHPTYGYFRVASFDFTNGQVAIVNECHDDNAAPGTFVPACTCFQVTDVPVDIPDFNQDVCVAIDFTAPAVGDCLDITLTTVGVLGVGETIQIGTGQYRIDALVSSTIITICNDGAGLTPGTAVIALAGDGNYQYCIQVIGNCCTTIESRFGGTLEPCSDFDNATEVYDQLSEDATGEINSVGNTVTTEPLNTTITNPSTCRTMKVSLTHSMVAIVRMEGGIQNAQAGFVLNLNDGGGGINVFAYQDTLNGGFNDVFTRQYTYLQTATIAPGATFTSIATAIVSNIANMNNATVLGLTVKSSGLAVAV